MVEMEHLILDGITMELIVMQIITVLKLDATVQVMVMVMVIVNGRDHQMIQLVMMMEM